jgi:hypothetical protein
VAALFAALAGAADAIGRSLGARRIGAAVPGTVVVGCALVPVALLAIAFPEGGSEPFAFSTFWPIPLIAAGALLALPPRSATLRAAVALYVLGTIAAYLVATPVGSNAARLGTFIALPLAALVLWPRRVALLAMVALPLLYLEWHDPVRDLSTASGDPSAAHGYYTPLLAYLERQPGPPFRVEIPFTQFHWEAYQVAPGFPLARGWERQLDIKYNRLFYGGKLTAATYGAWLRELAVRYVAVSDAPLDYSALAEQALINGGLPYLRLVFRSRHWRVYLVRGAAPIVAGAATLERIGPNSLTLDVRSSGAALVRVRFTPYWALEDRAGCVAPSGDFTKLTFRRPGRARLVIRFSVNRIGARSPRCT